MSADETIYVAAGGGSLESIARSLQELLPLRRRPFGVQRVTYYDTFDHRIAACGARLLSVQENGHTKLVWQPGDGRVGCDLRLSVPVAFAWDLAEGQLRLEVEHVIDCRRLLAEVELEREGTVLDHLDEHGKTVARIWLEAARARAPQATWRALPPLLRVLPVRGYQGELRSLLSIVDSRPGLRRVSEDLCELALRAAGRSGHVVPPVRLDADVDAGTGARRLLHALHETLVANEPGTRADLDSEFLHDFRVAVRRTRTLLTQFKSVFPAAVVEHYRGEFSWLGRVTGPTRDLDVLLSRLRREELDVALHDRKALYEFVAERQRGEHAKLVEQLDAPRYRKLIESWRRFLLEPPASEAAAEVPRRTLVDVVAERAGRVYRRMIERGRSIDDRSPAEELHELRLDAKKLCYLIDSAGSALPAKALGHASGPLRKLHALLGKVNDARVQQACFLDLARQVGVADRASPGVMLALGQLAERSRAQGERQRRRFSKRFARFARERTRRAVRRLSRSGGPR